MCLATKKLPFLSHKILLTFIEDICPQKECVSLTTILTKGQAVRNCRMDYPTDRLRDELEIDCLELSRKKLTLKMVYRGLNNMGPPVLNDLFNAYVPKRSLRSDAQYISQVPATKLVFSENDIAVRGCKYWNPINNDLKHSSTLEDFKRGIKKCDANMLS